MKINDIYEVTIDSVDINGNGVTRINNIVTFIPNALENEKIKINIGESDEDPVFTITDTGVIIRSDSK